MGFDPAGYMNSLIAKAGLPPPTPAESSDSFIRVARLTNQWVTMESGGSMDPNDQHVSRNPDGTWKFTRTGQQYGYAIGFADVQHHGFAGAINDVEKDPLGAAEAALVAVSAAPLAPFALAAAEGGAIVAGATGNVGNVARAVGAAATDPSKLAAAAISAGKTIASAEAAIASKVTGIPIKLPGGSQAAAPARAGTTPSASRPGVTPRLGFWARLWAELRFAVTGS